MKNKPVIGFIGNFEPSFSTENDRKWSFEKLGYKVVTFQENKTTIEELEEALRTNKFDVLFYSHTHGWEIPGLIKFFGLCAGMKVPTVSVHLDRWAWLDREKDIGKEATWYTEYLFMADFSPEAKRLYTKNTRQKPFLNQKVHYLKPGVVERDCYMDANYDSKTFLYDVVFVGSKGYHPEYPFRPMLVDFLKETYGDRFGHYGADGEGVARGDALNRLYAVSKVAVGDSCFGGRPNYVSDRYYETRGRGGFLVHPYVTGVDTIGVGRYGGFEHDKKNLESLKTTIDYFLRNELMRETCRKKGFEHVKRHETYTSRAREMMKIIS